MGQFEGWVILTLLKEDHGLPPHPDLQGEVGLRHIEPGSKLLNPSPQACSTSRVFLSLEVHVQDDDGYPHDYDSRVDDKHRLRLCSSEELDVDDVVEVEGDEVEDAEEEAGFVGFALYLGGPLIFEGVTRFFYLIDRPGSVDRHCDYH